MLPEDLISQAEKIVHLYIDKGWRLVTAESCTGGLIAACLTSVSGSSLVLERGFVTYSNASKHEELGIPEQLLEARGAVSEEVAISMADGARKAAKVDVGISVTGIAGPKGGSENKPVGLVYIAVSTEKKTEARRFKFDGDRTEIRRQSVVKALSWLLAVAKGE